MEKVFGIMKNFKVDGDRFKIIKSDMTRGFNNYFLESPSCHVEYYLNLALFQCIWSIEDQLREISHVEVADVEAFYPTLLHSLHIEVLFVGNIESSSS
jgi:insulysin